VGCDSPAAAHISIKNQLLKPFNTLYKTAVMCWVYSPAQRQSSSPGPLLPLTMRAGRVFINSAPLKRAWAKKRNSCSGVSWPRGSL